MLSAPTIILTLKIAVIAVTLLFLSSLWPLSRGNYRLHGRINVVHQRRRRHATTQVDRSGNQGNDQVYEPAFTCKNACVVAFDDACIRHLFIHWKRIIKPQR